MTIPPLFNSIKAAFNATGAAIIISSISITSLSLAPLVFSPLANAQPASISDDAGQVYTVKSGDGLYKLGRDFFGKGSDYKKIVTAHNAKAVTDSRFKKIDPDKGLTVGQLIWIPAKKGYASRQPGQSAQSLRSMRDNAQSSNTHSPNRKPELKPDTLVTDNSTPKPRNKNSNSNTKTAPEDPAYVVTPPKTNCEIRIWYNFQIVAIKQLNQRWIEEGMSVVERAKKAFQIRHDARLNGRYMMADKFEVAALRDRDNKKYGNPDGPTFEHMVAFGRENGLTGDRVYEGIIESSARVQPVYKSSCVKK